MVEILGRVCVCLYRPRKKKSWRGHRVLNARGLVCLLGQTTEMDGKGYWLTGAFTSPAFSGAFSTADLAGSGVVALTLAAGLA